VLSRFIESGGKAGDANGLCAAPVMVREFAQLGGLIGHGQLLRGFAVGFVLMFGERLPGDHFQREIARRLPVQRENKAGDYHD
jgi:hypothetical protein